MGANRAPFTSGWDVTHRIETITSTVVNPSRRTAENCEKDSRIQRARAVLVPTFVNLRN